MPSGAELQYRIESTGMTLCSVFLTTLEGESIRSDMASGNEKAQTGEPSGLWRHLYTVSD